VYVIGGGNEQKNINLVNQMCAILDEVAPPEEVPALREQGLKSYRELIRFVTDRPGHDHRYAIDSAKITRELGWQAQVGFEAGLRQTIEWYLSNPEWVDQVSQGSYGEWIKKNYAWRAGNIKELRAPDPYTVQYELEEPYSELLLQLTMFTNVIHNKESVEALGKDYGIKGADGTGPWCFESWQPRTEIVLKRHDAYKWGPSMYKNKGPVKFEKLTIKIVPEDSSRVAAMMSGQFDVTHQFPAQFISQAKAAPMLTVSEAKPNFQLLYFGFKTTRPMVADKRVREAMSIAINRAEIAKAMLQGNAEPAFTFVDKDALDHDPKTAGIVKEDLERAKALLDEAGWKMGSDGVREKDGIKLQPKVYYTQGGNTPRVAEAIQGYLRRIGVQWQLQPWTRPLLPPRWPNRTTKSGR
jgi:ABC-type transport system substrate-binding protein